MKTSTLENRVARKKAEMTGEKGDFEKMLDAASAMTPGPGEGFNVAYVDTYDDPGEGLHLYRHCKTREEAEEAAVACRAAMGMGTLVYVYGADE